jgi:circadian clock protein KaiC
MHDPAEAAGDGPIVKKRTGIRGFDDITGGGIPASRLTAIIGGPGAGKTVFTLQTLVNLLETAGEPGIFVTFEEPVVRIRRNMASFDWRIADLSEAELGFVDANLPVDAVYAGAFDLTGLLIGLSARQEETGARNIVFDGIDRLLSSLADQRLERQELGRLDQWIRESGMTALVTVKSFGSSARDQQRADFLQYMTDCVVLLDGTRSDATASRSLRVVKYRGSGFAANPVPVVFGRSGLQVVAFKGMRLDYPTFTERLSSRIVRLDALLNGGYIRGSSILISGSPGTSKTSLGASLAVATCERGEKALFISFDESASQIVANMKSIGLDLAPHVAAGRLAMESFLSSGRSPEEHFVAILDLLDYHAPQCLVIDPLSALLKAQYPFADIVCESLIDTVKTRGITILCTSLLDQVGGQQETSASHISTIADTWLHVSYLAHEGERNRALTIVKSRGTGHSNQVRELVLDDSGIDLVDVYLDEGQVLMGTARIQKEANTRRKRAEEEVASHRIRMELDRDLADIAARVEAARRELVWKQQEAAFFAAAEDQRIERERIDMTARREHRRADHGTVPVPSRGTASP